MNKTLQTLVFSLLLLLGMTTLGFSQGATITWVYDNIDGHPPLATLCTGGTPLQDGVIAVVKWDWDNNGPDVTDPFPTNPNWTTFPLNGFGGGQGAGYFYTDPALVIPILPATDSSYYYVQVSVTGDPGACWNSPSYHIDPGPSEISISGFACVTGPCPTDVTPPDAVTNVQASDNTLCMRVNVSWEHDGEGVDGFSINDEAGQIYQAFAADRSATIQFPDEAVHHIYVQAYNAGGPSDTTAESSDEGGTYLLHFADGPTGRIVGTSLSGDSFHVAIARPEGQCFLRYALSVWDSVNHVVLYDSFMVDSVNESAVQMINGVLPTGTEPFLKLLVRAQLIERPTVNIADTTEGYFCLGVCGGANDQPVVIPDHFELAQNYPNPFNPETQIEFLVPYQSDVKVEVYNISGQLVKTLVDGRITAGVHHIAWNGLSNSGTNVSSGVYLYRMTGPGFVQTKKMLMLK